MTPAIRQRPAPKIDTSNNLALPDHAIPVAAYLGAGDPRMRLGWVVSGGGHGYDVYMATGPGPTDYVYSGHASNFDKVFPLLPDKPWSMTRGIPVARGDKSRKRKIKA